ncbi:MAG: hypothetical protein ACP5VR_05960 [Acidimicrobiales bacterium]
MRQVRGASEELSSWLPAAMPDGPGKGPASAGEDMGPLGADELPTLPPPPRRGPGWLRWAGDTAVSTLGEDAVVTAEQPVLGEAHSAALPRLGELAPAGDGPGLGHVGALRRARSFALVIVTVLVATGLVAAGVLIGLQLGGGKPSRQLSGGAGARGVSSESLARPPLRSQGLQLASLGAYPDLMKVTERHAFELK